MCFVLLALQQHPKYPFILLSNRDEFYARPTQAMQPWHDNPAVLGGRDLEAGGSWLALNRDNGRLALVTNYREVPGAQNAEFSRGALVQDWVFSKQSATAAGERLHHQRDAYAGFNLLMGRLPQAIYYYSNRAAAKPRRLEPGLYGLSNALLDIPWPKVTRSKQRLADYLQAQPNDLDNEKLLAILADRSAAADNELPDTGIGLDKERMLAPVFIKDTNFAYGTRCSTLIWVNEGGEGLCHERSFSAQGVTDNRTFHFNLPDS